MPRAKKTQPLHIERDENPNWTWCRRASYGVKTLPLADINIYDETVCVNCLRAFEAYQPVRNGIQLPENVQRGLLTKRGWEKLKRMQG